MARLGPRTCKVLSRSEQSILQPRYGTQKNVMRKLSIIDGPFFRLISERHGQAECIQS
jgi:hypothetical protein